MALTARFLIDTSAAARMNQPSVARVVAPLIDSGVVATTAVLDAEAFHSARSPGDLGRMRDRRRVSYEYLPTNDEHWQNALDTQFSLAKAGLHRSVGIADLLTATVAAENGVIVVHYDHDFDIAAIVLDFEHRWVAPPGTLS